ncbi:MAG: hypothetical protein QW638_00215 [Candidatus Bathyarchaeia archaeon]
MNTMMGDAEEAIVYASAIFEFVEEKTGLDIFGQYIPSTLK